MTTWCPGRSLTAACMLAVLAAAAPAAGQPRGSDLGAQRGSVARWLVQIDMTAQQAERQRIAAERLRRQAEARRLAQERNVRNWPEATEPFSRTLRLPRNGTFDLQNIAGDIVITGGGGDQIRIEATKRVRHRLDAQARATLADLRIAISDRGGNVEVRTMHPRRRDVVAAVDYTVTLPSGANVVVGTGSGHVQIRNVSGELRATTLSGNVTASSVRRVRHISTVSGNVDVSDGEADELSANTVDGDVIVRNLKGRVLDLRTVTGDVRLVDLDLDRASLQSMAGDLEYAGRLARSGRYEFQTHSGNIRLMPEGNPGFDLQASTFNGDVRSDFTLRILPNPQPGARRPPRSLRGTFGDAAAVVTAESFSGDILIVRK